MHCRADTVTAERCSARPCSGLLTERTGLETKLGRAYGPDDVFLPLDGQCFSTTADKYTYEVCPFGQAAQKEGASSTRCASSCAGLADHMITLRQQMLCSGVGSLANCFRAHLQLILTCDTAIRSLCAGGPCCDADCTAISRSCVSWQLGQLLALRGRLPVDGVREWPELLVRPQPEHQGAAALLPVHFPSARCLRELQMCCPKAR